MLSEEALLLVGLFVFVLQLMRQKRTVTDAWDEIFLSNHISDKYIPRSEPLQEFTYPPATALLAKYLAFDGIIDRFKYFNFAIDFVLFLIVAITLFGLDKFDVKIVLALLMSSPHRMSPWAGYSSVSARVIGKACVVSLLCAAISLNIYLFIAAAFFICLIMIYSSKFALQCLVIILPIIAVIEGTEKFVATVLCIGIIIALSKRARTILKGHYQHSKFYRQTLSSVNQNIQKTYRDSLKDKVKKTKIIRILTYSPTILYVPVLVQDLDWFRPLSLYVFIVFVVVSTKYFRFLGEAERYVYWLLTPFCLVYASDYEHVYLFVIINTLISVSMFLLYRKNGSHINLSGVQAAIEYLDKHHPSALVLMNPLNLMGYGLKFSKYLRFYGFLQNAPLGSPEFNEISNFIEKSGYPYLQNSTDFKKVDYLISTRELDSGLKTLLNYDNVYVYECSK